jgi:hypothetical protein
MHTNDHVLNKWLTTWKYILLYAVGFVNYVIYVVSRMGHGYYVCDGRFSRHSVNIY